MRRGASYIEGTGGACPTYCCACSEAVDGTRSEFRLQAGVGVFRRSRLLGHSLGISAAKRTVDPRKRGTPNRPHDEHVDHRFRIVGALHAAFCSVCHNNTMPRLSRDNPEFVAAARPARRVAGTAGAMSFYGETKPMEKSSQLSVVGCQQAPGGLTDNCEPRTANSGETPRGVTTNVRNKANWPTPPYWGVGGKSVGIGGGIR